MSIHDVLMSKCDLCSGQNLELQMIFKQLYRKMKKVLTSPQWSLQLEMSTGPEMEGFAQLLRVLNVRKPQRRRQWTDCKHPRVFKMLQKSLNCNFSTLNYLCEITANKLGQKNYGLALLEAQFKNISGKVANQDLSSPPPLAVIKEEPKIVSMTSLPTEREMEQGSGKCVTMLGSTQTTIEQIGLEYLAGGYNFYCQFPYFFGK